jgi:hypothetical protein
MYDSGEGMDEDDSGSSLNKCLVLCLPKQGSASKSEQPSLSQTRKVFSITPTRSRYGEPSHLSLEAPRDVRDRDSQSEGKDGHEKGNDALGQRRFVSRDPFLKAADRGGCCECENRVGDSSDGRENREDKQVEKRETDRSADRRRLGLMDIAPSAIQILELWGDYSSGSCTLMSTRECMFGRVIGMKYRQRAPNNKCRQRFSCLRYEQVQHGRRRPLGLSCFTTSMQARHSGSAQARDQSRTRAARKPAPSGEGAVYLAGPGCEARPNQKEDHAVQNASVILRAPVVSYILTISRGKNADRSFTRSLIREPLLSASSPKTPNESTKICLKPIKSSSSHVLWA